MLIFFVEKELIIVNFFQNCIMGNNQSLLKDPNIMKTLQNIAASNPSVPAQCNWKDNSRCIFRDYTKSGNSCLVQGNNNPPYSGLENYNEQQFADWLQALYNRNTGNDSSRGEAANVYQYWNTCKSAPGYEFLKKLNFSDPNQNNTDFINKTKDIVNNYVNERKSNFKNLQEMELVRADLYKKVQLLQSRQDLYLESARLNEVGNKKKLEDLDKDISVMRRQIMYDFESDMVHNSKIYFLGNITFYIILFIIGLLVYRRFLSE
jgi:hypothetical protein